jgi:hypothetical protein
MRSPEYSVPEMYVWAVPSEAPGMIYIHLIVFIISFICHETLFFSLKNLICPQRKDAHIAP